MPPPGGFIAKMQPAVVMVDHKFSIAKESPAERGAKLPRRGVINKED